MKDEEQMTQRKGTFYQFEMDDFHNIVYFRLLK